MRHTVIRYAKTNLTAQKFDVFTDANYGNAVSQSSKSVPYVPRNMFSFFADYTFYLTTLKGFGINFGTRYTGFTYASSVESFKTSSYILFDVGAHYDFGQLSSSLRGLRAQLAMPNVVNTYYMTQYDTDFCNLGQGRRVYGNLTFNW